MMRWPGVSFLRAAVFLCLLVTFFTLRLLLLQRAYEFGNQLLHGIPLGIGEIDLRILGIHVVDE
jgi:hypothetical protein